MKNFNFPARTLLLCALLCACASTAPAPPVVYSGFLRDYSILTPGEGPDQVALRYVNPDANLGRYTKVMIDPVVVYHGVGSGMHDIPEKDLVTLANHLYAALVMHLENDYPIVQRPGRDVLRVQVALTEAKGSDVVMNTISSAMPIRPVSGLTELATGTQAFVGSAGIEARIVDAESDALLVAVVDRRQGGKQLAETSGTWNDVLAAFEYWADRLQSTLAAARAEASTAPAR